MCGIAGFVDFGNRPVADLAAALARMQGALRHRGPDGAGKAVLYGSRVWDQSASGETQRSRSAADAPTVGLAHLRLAIIDLSAAGHQPMASGNEADWLTYNGELYNYRDLRGDLVGRGMRLRSTSDTEVLVELLAAEGTTALSRVRGMFAFAWWSERDRRLVLARDRFGIKPLLFVCPSPDFVLFASEPRSLAASGYVRLEPSDGGRAEFLARGSIDASASFWKGISSVPPGTCITFDGRGSVARTYWSLEEKLLDRTERAPVRVVAQAVRTALVQSVESHLVSDVPVAIFLSGGLDSTAVLAAAREVTSGPLQTFTVTMPGSPLDETKQAREAAGHYGSDHTELAIDDLDVDAALDEFFSAMQSPSVDGLNTFLVARAACRAGARVVLSGVGADELFGGYNSFTYVPRLHRMLTRYGPPARLAASILPRLTPQFAARLKAVFASRPHTVIDTWWRSRQLFPDPDLIALTGASGLMPKARAGRAAAFDQVRYCEFKHFLGSQLLGDADAFTMCRALELRTPFVDHCLLEATLAAGRWKRARGLSYKGTLFRHLAGLALPAAIKRPKQGFVLPFDSWIREALTRDVPPRLGDFKARLLQPCYHPFVARYLDGHLHWSRLWALYVLERVLQPESAGPPRLSPGPFGRAASLHVDEPAGSISALARLSHRS
jgi:asparagine synthase (glutamine-hydrolysing)